jgi:hypothetical protein
MKRAPVSDRIDFNEVESVVRHYVVAVWALAMSAGAAWAEDYPM